MVAIVSGNTLGLNLTSLGTLGQQGRTGAAGEGRNGQAAYVNIANGNLVLQSEDEYLAARGPDARALRTYNSQGTFNDDNGDNWSNGAYLQPLVLSGTLNTAGSTIRRTDSDGSVATYTFDTAKGRYLTTAGGGAHDSISYIAADNQFEWRDGSTGLVQRYHASSEYRLLSSRDSSGNALTYSYNASGRLSSVVSASGETIHYDYAGNNLTQIRSVKADGTTATRTRYSYDASNRLSGFTVDLSANDNSIADGKTYNTTYTYDGTSKRIASITQRDGTSLTFTYILVGADYRVASVKDGLNQTTTYSYDTTTRQTAVTDPLGLVTAYQYDAGGQLTKITGPGGAAAQISTFTYGAAGDLASVTDAEGRVLTFGYDANGNEIMRRDSAGNTVTRTYDARNQLQTETVYLTPDPDGAGTAQPGTPLTTRHVYDSAGRNLLRFAISAEGRVTEHRYNAHGERTSTFSYGGSAYSVAALAPTAVPAESDMVTWAGTQSTAQMQRVDSSYDARGQLQSVTSYAALDAAGTGVADGTHSIARYVYDQSGLLLQTISATGATTNYTYDSLGRVISASNGLGQVTLTQYTDSGNKTTVTLANGLSTTSTYDAAGRLVSVLSSNAAAATLGETKYFYDGANRLRMTQDPTGVRHWMLYDDAGRKVADIDGNGSMTEYTYNRNGLLTYSAAYGTAVSTAGLVDGAGAPVLTATVAAFRPVASAGDLKTWRAYDTANRLVRVAEATNTSTAAVSETLYDGASRAVQVVRYANTLVPGSASLTPGVIAAPAVSAQNRVTRNFHDADGRLVGTLDAEGYLTQLSYDAAGQLRERISYATVTNASLRATGTLAQLVPAASGNDIRVVTLYNRKGLAIAEVDGEGYLTENVYDANGNLSQSVRYANRVTATVTTSSTVASLRPASSPSDRATLRTYDALNRIAQETSAEGVVTQYAYDNAGNLTSTVRAAGSTEVRTLLARYDLQGRLTGELSAEGAVLLIGGQTQAQVDAIWAQHGSLHVYDAAGRRMSTTDASGNRTLFFYNLDGQLTHTVNALGEVQERRYDSQGRLTTTIAYAGRISTAALTGSLAGGLANSTLTTAVAGVANGAVDTQATITYTSNSKVASTTDALGNVTTYTRNSFGEEVGSSQAIGGGALLTQTHTLDRRGLRTGTVADAPGVNAVTTAIYDAFGRATRTIDGNGNVRDYSFDRLGRTISTVDPVNALRRSTYDAFSRVLTQTDALGQVTTYAYDSAARTMSVTTPEGIRTTTAYTRHGQVQSITDGKGLLTRYTYDRNGNLLQTTTPLTTSASAYDSAGRLIETTDAKGKKIAYAYDAASRVLTRRVDPAGLNLTSTYQYDGKGQQVSVTDPAGVVTKIDYDRKGQQVKHTVDPTGLNLQTVYTYDGRGKTLTVTSPGGSVTQYAYDALGRRTQERVDPAGLNLTRSWVYDKNGNAVSSTAALGGVTRYAYDANDRLVFTVDPLGNVGQASYDAEGRVVKSASYATPISLTGLAAAPTVSDIQSRVVSAPVQDVVEHRVYDKDNRLSATVNGIGAVTRYTYDANGNVASRVRHATAIVMSSWTPGTLPAPTADAAHDERLVTVYDNLNRAIYSMDGVGAVVAHSYDGNGNVVQRIAYATAIPTNTAVSQTAIATAVAAVADAARDSNVRNAYDAAGRLTWTADGTGAATRLTYDKNGNLVHRRAYAIAIVAGAAPSTAVGDANDRIDSMAYDAANRLVFHVNVVNAVTEQVYDANSNIVRRISYANGIASVPTLGTLGTVAAIRAAVVVNAGADRSTHYGFDAAGRQVLVIDPLGAVTETQLDAAGNAVAVTGYANIANTASLAAVPTLAALKALITSNATGDRTSKSAYDAAGRLVYNVDPLGAVKYTQYDGIGRVTRSTRYAVEIPTATANTADAIAGACALVVSATTDQVEVFSYNAAGRLIVGTDALGRTESYTYDALGQKRTFTNKKGAVWSYDYSASGRQITETTPQVYLAGVTVNAAGNLVESGSGNAAIINRFAYDALGNLIRRTEASGRAEERITQYQYDAAGRQIKTIYPPVGVYNAAGDSVTTNGATGVASRIETTMTLEAQTFYDTLGNAVAGRDVGNGISQKAYDRLGRVVYSVDALGFVTGYAYNAFSEVVTLTRYGSGTTLAERTLTQASHAATRAQVDAALAAPTFSHANDRILRTSYDRAGRVAEVIEPTAFTYDSSAATAAARKDAGKTTRNIYNTFGQLVQAKVLQNPYLGTWAAVSTHYFDRAGRETETVDALGYLTTKAYDRIGNLTRVIEHASALAAGSWTVSGYGTAPAASPDNRRVDYAYDRANRKTSETRVNVEFSTAADGTSTRGNLTTSYGYDAVGNLTRTTDADGKSTFTYYDAMGRVSAVAAPPRTSTVSGANLTPLTVFRRDAHGNVLVKIDYVNGAATASQTAYTASAANAADRTTLARYDSFGRNTQTTDANGASAYLSYDAFGHLAKKWQGVTGNDGVTRTAFEVYRYDKLGQLTETRTPATATVLRQGLNATFTPPPTDEYGSPLAPYKLELGWSGLINPQGGAVRVQVDYVTQPTVQYDQNGNPISSEPAHAASFSQDFAAGASAAGLTMTWSQGATNVSAIHVMQYVGGQWVTKWEGGLAFANGSTIADVTQAQAGVVSSAMEYNAFGELTRRGSQGGRQEYFDYDTAGRLWRTNSGDGIDRITLFDAMGHATSEIRSSGIGRDNRDIKSFSTAQAADADLNVRRTDINYDLLGRVTAQVQAERLELQGGVSVNRAFVSATVAGQPQSTKDDLGNVTWTGSYQVNVGWNSLASLGSGDVKVYLEYQTPTTQSGGGESGPVVYYPGVARSYTSGVLGGDTASGVQLVWPHDQNSSISGIGQITRVVVYKKDVNGYWQAVFDQNPGYSANYVEVAAPASPGTAVSLELRPAGSTGAWTPVGLTDFGSAYRFDAASLATGNYEYRVSITPTGEALRIIGTGTLGLSQPPLTAISVPITYGPAGAGIMVWQRPAASVEQVLRYRAAGSSGSWTALAVTPRTTGTGAYDGVDTRSLPPGDYQFELLWTNAGQGAPYAHATGQFTVTAPKPAYWVPPVNLPHITGLGISTAVVGGTITGYDESGQPIYSGGTTVPALAWTAANATTARYRVAGGAWTNLAINNSGQSYDESGNVTGLQKAALNGIAPGTYQIEVLAGSPTNKQATGNLTIYAQNPGYYRTVTVQVPKQQPIITGYQPVYETRYGTRTVSYQVEVWTRYVSGYDESGNPIYSYRSHWETRYREETYSYQVQVGQTPIYARDESGNILYETVYVSEERQEWVEGTTPTPTVNVTTPPYTAGYTVAAVPKQYGVLVNTGANTQAISTLSGSTLTQAAGTNGGNRWMRPTVAQKTDRWGNVIEITDPRAAYWKTTYKYNANNQLIRETKPDTVGAISGESPVTQIFFDKLGRQVAVKDANGNVNGQVFDAGGNLIEERHADTGVVTHRYNAFGEKVQTMQAEGNRLQALGQTSEAAKQLVTFTYDKMGHMLSMVQGQAGVYRANGSNYLEYVNTRNITESWTYDQLGRKLTQTNGNNETLSYIYDLRGNVIETKQPLGQRVRAAFDAQGRKVVEVDANGYANTWTYDYFGLLTGHTDLGGARYSYSYDNARQLTAQSNTRGQSLTYTYDAAGQMASITDWANGKVSTYMYDLSGRKIRERVQQGGATYQDNHLSYDAQGNLRDVADARVHITIDYDKVGNRKRIYTRANYQGTGGETTSETDKYFFYDQMNRQIVVDAIDSAGNLGTQGHRLEYDANGNRTSDTYRGNRVAASGGQQIIVGYDEGGAALYSTSPTTFTSSTGEVREEYRYDTLNRLQSVVRDGVQIDHRLYDGAGRVVQSGPGGRLPQGYADKINEGLAPGQSNGKETRINRYDANGRLMHMKVLKSDNGAKADISYDPSESVPASWMAAGYKVEGYDAAGNVRGYAVFNHEGQSSISQYQSTLARHDGYQDTVTKATSSQLQAGTSTQQYDANGFLVGVSDATQANNNRSLINDASGRALYVNQAGHVRRQLIVNGEVLGLYGVGVNPHDPASGNNNNPNFANLVDFDFGYSRISANYPNPSPGAYQVRVGDTLQIIAQGAYGDSSLWYRIAEANGLGGNNDLKVGQTLNIPNRVGTISNNATTFKPYDPSQIEGDTTPNMAMPEADDCGGLGQMIMIVVAIVVTIYTAGALTGAVGSGFGATMSAGVGVASGTGAAAATAAASALGTVGTMAVSAAVGSIASQVVGMAIGAVDKFSWKGVALAAIAGGVSAGIPTGMFSGLGTVGGAVARAALANSLTQGISVVVGLQDKFDWRGVAASAVAAGVSAAAADGLLGSSMEIHDPMGLKNTEFHRVGSTFTDAFREAPTVGRILGATLTSMAGGLTVAAMRGGHVSMQQVATDAFGNAIGQSLAEVSGGANSPSSKNYESEMDRASDRYNPASAYGYRNGSDVESDNTYYDRATGLALAAPGSAYWDHEWPGGDRAPNDALQKVGFRTPSGKSGLSSGPDAGSGLKMTSGLNPLDYKASGRYAFQADYSVLPNTELRLRTQVGLTWGQEAWDIGLGVFNSFVVNTGDLALKAAGYMALSHPSVVYARSQDSKLSAAIDYQANNFFPDLSLPRADYSTPYGPLAEQLSDYAQLGMGGYGLAKMALRGLGLKSALLGAAGSAYSSQAEAVPSVASIRGLVVPALGEGFSLARVTTEGVSILRRGEYAFYQTPLQTSAQAYRRALGDLRAMDTMGDTFTSAVQEIRSGYSFDKLSEGWQRAINSASEPWIRARLESAARGSYVDQRIGAMVRAGDIPGGENFLKMSIGPDLVPKSGVGLRYEVTQYTPTLNAIVTHAKRYPTETLRYVLYK